MLWLWLGLADDWTPAAPCKALVAAAGPRVQWQAYAGAFHGFDSTVAVRLETFIRNTWSLAR